MNILSKRKYFYSEYMYQITMAYTLNILLFYMPMLHQQNWGKKNPCKHEQSYISPQASHRG